MDKEVNLSEFARQSLAEGRGEWWIVSEMATRWGIEETEGRTIVARVSPLVYRRFLWRRRCFLFGGAFFILLAPVSALIDFDFRSAFYTAGFLIVGTFMIAYGWPGLRRWKGGDPPTSLPGRMKPANWRNPFGSD